MGLQEDYRLFNAIRDQLIASIAEVVKPPEAALREVVRQAFGGSLKFADACVVKAVLAQYRPTTILEIGSFLGFSTRWFLECCRREARLTAVDPNIRHRIFSAPRDVLLHFNEAFVGRQLDVVTAFVGRVPERIAGYYSEEVRENENFAEETIDAVGLVDASWGRRFDLVFIDADHSYEACRDNFHTCLEMLNPGGVILFHDAITWDGVARCIGELQEKYAGAAEVGVINALDIYDHPALAAEPMRQCDGIGYYIDKRAMAG